MRFFCFLSSLTTVFKLLFKYCRAIRRLFWRGLSQLLEYPFSSIPTQMRMPVTFHRRRQIYMPKVFGN